MTKRLNVQTIDASSRTAVGHTPARAERRPARQTHGSSATDSMGMKLLYLEARADALRLGFGG